MRKKRNKERWRKKYAGVMQRVKVEKFTYRGDGTGKIEFLVDGQPLFNTGPVLVGRFAAGCFVDQMNSYTDAELRECGQREAAKFINAVMAENEEAVIIHES